VTPPAAPGLPTRRPRARQPAGIAEAFGATQSHLDVRLLDLPITQIERDPDQPRKRFNEQTLRQLADSIAERGVLQPVLVRRIGEERYKLIAGERRCRASQLAGLGRIPAFVRDNAEDATALELALIENTVRDDITVVEEARTLVTLIEDLQVTQETIAVRIGRSRSDLANTIRLLDLPDEVLDLLEDGRLTKGHGKALLAEPDHARRRDLARRAAVHEWSVRQLADAIANRASITSRRRVVPADAAAAGRELAERLEHHVPAPVIVRPRGTGFTIQIKANDLAHAQTIVDAITTDPELDELGPAEQEQRSARNA
jgi:ParB family transcriptional regulator, chromosome partitioning protein